MVAIEHIKIYWDGDRALLPSIPVSDTSENEVYDFELKMDAFINLWEPTPPEGKGWQLLEKTWVCADSCKSCGFEIEAGHSCIYQGVRPHSVWQREGTN